MSGVTPPMPSGTCVEVQAYQRDDAKSGRHAQTGAEMQGRAPVSGNGISERGECCLHCNHGLSCLMWKSAHGEHHDSKSR